MLFSLSSNSITGGGLMLTNRVYVWSGFRGRGGGGGPNFDIKGGDWPCPNRLALLLQK